MNTHANLSPSSADRWMVCPGSVVLSEGVVDEGSEYAKEGTAAHELAELTLKSGTADASKYIGRKAENGIEFTEEMAEYVMVYVNNVRDYAKDNELLVEQRLSIEHLTGEEGAKGTSDTVIIAGDEIQVHDLKYGMGVKVDAENNKQLMIYALAALREFDLIGDFKRARLVIHQPRLKHISEWDVSVEDLQRFAINVGMAAAGCNTAKATYGVMVPVLWDKTYLNPSSDGCKWCKVKADCNALRDFTLQAVTGDDLVDCSDETFERVAQAQPPEDNALLGKLLGAIDLIESWCTAIRGKANAELREGRDVPGWKLVIGRKGARSWADDKQAEELMKSMRLKVDEMYSMKVISPTQAEKVLSAKPKCWKRIEPLITQAEGALSIAPLTDKRPAVEVKRESFENLEETEGLV